MTRQLLIVALMCLITGCSQTLHRQCERWQRTGQVVSTLDSCVQCLDTLGPSNLDSIRGCALGLDAAKLLQPQGR